VVEKTGGKLRREWQMKEREEAEKVNTTSEP